MQKTNFIEELRWRGMLHDVMPDTEELLNKQSTRGYIGFDPTADSLHVGHLTQIMTLLHFQKAGHQPIALIGGATGLIGDPSGKSSERNLLEDTELQHNIKCIETQLYHFLNFFSSENSPKLYNNYTWFQNINFINFIRDVGKHITVNYMLSKDSVKNRIEGNGMSFTEFTYQLIQGYDFMYLYTNMNCQVQLGGSDQWGNMTTGTDLIHKMSNGKAYAVTTNLIRKSDGTKFGKTENGTIWLDRNKTSPYKFYQFWLNATDEDAKIWIYIFTFLSKLEIETLMIEHTKNPNAHVLQKALAKEVTIRVHSELDYNNALEASNILFKSTTIEPFINLAEDTFLEIFTGVEQYSISIDKLLTSLNVVELFATLTNIFTSKNEVRKMIKGGGVSINKNKVGSDYETISVKDLIHDKYLIVQKGKRNYILVIFK